MSTEAAAPFLDLMAPGEQIGATMAGAGPNKPNGARVWVQVALADGPGGQRLLAVVLVQAPHGGAWQPVARHAAPTAGMRLARYPRTPTSAARLELSGLAEPLVLLDIDDPNVFPYLEPFLAAWTGMVEGAGVVTARQREEEVQGSGPDPRFLLAVAGGMLVLLAGCCGLSFVGSLLAAL